MRCSHSAAHTGRRRSTRDLLPTGSACRCHRGAGRACTPTLFARRLGGPEKPTITAITPEWHRFDLTLTSATDPRPHGYIARQIFARPGAEPAVTFAPRVAGANRGRLPALVDDFLRVLGLLPVVIGRGELLAGLTPVAILRDALIKLYLLENSVARGGAKRLNAYLTDEQRRALEALPPLAPTRDAIIKSHRAIAQIFLLRARQLAVAQAVDYPDRFERATLDHLAWSLGFMLDAPD